MSTISRAPSELGIDYAKLPSVIAIPLAEVDSETHPIVQLWRICDTAELSLRLVVAIAAAELERCGGLPDRAYRIKHPSLDDWLNVARRLAKAANEKLGVEAVVPELNRSVEQILGPLLKGPEQENKRKASIEESINTLRNQLAHGAGFGRAAGEPLLPAHRDRLLKAIQNLDWLKEIHLIASGEDGQPVVLAGLHPKTVELASVVTPEIVKALSGLGGEVLLARGTSVLKLWPLHAFARPEILRLGRGEITGDKPVPLIYARCEGDRLEMTGLGSIMPVSELRGTAVERLKKLFRLDEGGIASNITAGDFRKEFVEEAQCLVGRGEICKVILSAVESAEGGVLWLHGFAGMGKSAVMARTAIALESGERNGQLLVAYRFSAGDPRSTREKFLRYAIKQLQARRRRQAPQHSSDDAEKLEARLEELLASNAARVRVVFLLDGLDEIAQVDSRFPELPFNHQHDGVVWLCAGRPEPSLERLFSADRSKRIFPDNGLTGLPEHEVSEWLKRDGPSSLRDAIVRLEGNDGSVPAWIKEVWQRAEGGLPAYIKLLLADFGTYEASVGQMPPKGLVAYFDTLLKRGGVDDPAATLPILMAAISLSVEAPDAETLGEVLRRAGYLRPETRNRHKAIVCEAIARARAMLRTVVAPGGASDHYLPYHDELTYHLTSTPTLANARAIAAEGWRLLSLDPTRASQPARQHALATGVRQLVRLGHEESAARLYTDLRYHRARLEEPGGKLQLLRDLKIIHALLAYRSDELFERYLAFLARASRSSTWRNSPLSTHERRDYTNAFLVSWAGLLRRTGDLSKAKSQLEACMGAAIGSDGMPAVEALEGVARIEYELGYIQFLNGDLDGARELLNKSVNHAMLAGDEIGAWVARCVCAHFEAQFGAITFEAFDNLLCQALVCFKRASWNITAERWVMNTMAHRFDAAFYRDDVEAAEALLKGFTAHAWVTKYGSKELTVPYSARMHLLRGEYSLAVEKLASYLYPTDGRDHQNPRTEGLARLYLDYGHALKGAGDLETARRVWLDGISLPDDCGNQAWQERIRVLLDV